ncbi:response regulator transcription factor [Tissierella pigra]|uniref:Response regulator transcription factor n=1 Tax=Tissierella pigra TaxID=2607614 RepID=A0A6N7Y3X3_9FIRM|nr:response regulator transcription factor [Tissierella pigra]MBU5426321.1 response regulator transcription factor [Tissierella pigra]MSU02730.1 response regulator transcription factor [Tissierella pigra]
MSTILIIEDDKLLNEGITFSLQSEGYIVLSAYNGKQAMELLNYNPDLIILDINLPDKNGVTLCEYIREDISVPIIFLTAKDTEEDIVKGFKAGGDDYITKPFSLPILKERIKAVLKRRIIQRDSVYYYKNLIFDFDKLKLIKDDVEVPITATEVKLLELFIQNKGKVLTRTQILDKIWDIDGDFVDENTISVNIRRLRAKIEDDPSKPIFIKTVFGIGYIWGDNR